MTVTVDEPQGTEARRGFRRAAAALVALLVLAGLVWWSVADHGSRRPGGTSATHGSSGANGSSGLGTGTAAADLRLASRSVSGVPRGFPQTVDGAVQAYVASVGTFVMGMAGLSDAQLATFVRDFTGADLDYRPLAAQKRQVVGLAAADASPNRALYAACPPALGAYKAVRTSAADVTVSFWGPCVYGLDRPGGGRLDVVWQWSTARMRWSEHDWRLVPASTGALPRAPRPSDVDRPATTYAERARLLGPGWRLFDGAAQRWSPASVRPVPVGPASTDSSS